MNREQRRAADPIIRRLEQDIEAGRLKLRYDPSSDMMTLVVYRPDVAITVHDAESGAYIDVDPEERRISAMTIMNFQRTFLPRHAARPLNLRTRLGFRLLLALDWLGMKLGRDTEKLWDDWVNRRDTRDALKRYRRELSEHPERLPQLRTAHSFVPAG